MGDHAGKNIPAQLDGLGLSQSDLQDHIAYDPGVDEAVAEWGDKLGASSLRGVYSRLLADLNRADNDPTVVPAISDRRVVPGNLGLCPTSLAERIQGFHRPYHEALATLVNNAVVSHGRARLLSIHSFTPVWRGVMRDLEVGLLHAAPPDFLDMSYNLLRQAGYKVGINEPYDGALPGDCMDRHGLGKHPHMLIEIRNDLLQNADWRAGFLIFLKKIDELMEVDHDQ